MAPVFFVICVSRTYRLDGRCLRYLKSSKPHIVINPRFRFRSFSYLLVHLLRDERRPFNDIPLFMCDIGVINAALGANGAQNVP